MEKCSVGNILESPCGTGKYRIYKKTEIEDLTLEQAELLRLRSRIANFDDVIDVCNYHKKQFLDDFSNNFRYKCADPLAIHKSLVKTNLHEVSLEDFKKGFFKYDILPGLKVGNCWKKISTISENIDSEESEENIYDVSFESASGIVHKSLQLLDCSPLKTVKTDRKLYLGKRKINDISKRF